MTGSVIVLGNTYISANKDQCIANFLIRDRLIYANNCFIEPSFQTCEVLKTSQVLIAVS
jgi:hypothetical protein